MTVLTGMRVYPDQTIATKLSAAVSLIDDYTEKQAFGDVQVYIKGLNVEPVRNLGGYYLFFKLHGDDEEYIIRAAAGFYFEKEKAFKISELDSSNPVVQLTLKPKPAYPFPSGSTLIRGMVKDRNKNPVPRARVEVTGKEVGNETTGRGEFVLYFKGLKEEDLIDTKYVRGKGGRTIHLRAGHHGKTGLIDLEEVEEGRTTIVKEPIILK